MFNDNVAFLWVKDVPHCAWERLFDWGYTKETVAVGHVLVACETILQLIEEKDDYYFLEFDDMPLFIAGMTAEAQGFIDKYSMYKGVGIE